jgi:hypothetical protein
MSKRSVLVLLVGLNLVLLGALILSVYSPPAAYAQAPGRSGDYLLVSGRVQAAYDAVYLFDLRNRLLHVFRAGPGQPINVFPVDTRDLSRDFRRGG